MQLLQHLRHGQMRGGRFVHLLSSQLWGCEPQVSHLVGAGQ